MGIVKAKGEYGMHYEAYTLRARWLDLSAGIGLLIAALLNMPI